MTAIEFFDLTSVENVVSTLISTPDKVIFIGENKNMKRFAPVFQAFLDRRGLTTVVEYRSVPQNDLPRTVEELSRIVEEEEDCVFDLTGGNDLALVALGMVYERYRDKKNIQLQRFNVRNSAVTDCDGDGQVVADDAPLLTVEELIGLHGGTIREEEEDHAGTFCWDLTPDFIEDVEMLWNVCREDPGLWNTQLNVLGAVAKQIIDGDPLSVSADLNTLQRLLPAQGTTYVDIRDLLRFLDSYGFIEDLEEDDGRVIFAFKNEQVRRCLIKAGTVLELKVLITANRLTEKDGTPCYTASMNGVFIDWDGALHEGGDDKKDTENEIDVVLLRGLQPVFISCKNGAVEDDELYKLEAVADRFGGPYVKKVLVATYLGKHGDSKEHFRQRAKDMKIHLVDGVHDMDDREFDKTIKQLVNS